MLRFAKTPVTLSDGTVIPKGSTLMVLNDWAHSSEHFPDAEKFDMMRFARLRDRPGEHNQHLFSTPSADQMGWGFGTCGLIVLVHLQLLTRSNKANMPAQDDFSLPTRSRSPCASYSWSTTLNTFLATIHLKISDMRSFGSPIRVRGCVFESVMRIHYLYRKIMRLVSICT